MDKNELVKALRTTLEDYDYGEDINPRIVRQALQYLVNEGRAPSMFPAPIDDIEIRRITYLPGYGPADPENERRFDIVKWEDSDLYTHRTCYSLAHLEWDEREHCFDFNSVGVRWLEAAPSKEVCNMILDFCNEMELKYREEDA